MKAPVSKVTLDQLPVTAIKGVGASLSAKLAKIGLFSVQDVLLHLPLRYMDRTRITPIGALQPNVNAVIEAEVRACDIVFGKRRSLVCKVQDGTGTITLRFYHFNNAQKQRLVNGVRLRIFGETRRGASGLEMYHPEYDELDTAAPLPLAQSLTPVYPATEGLTQSRLRSLAAQALKLLDQYVLNELLPAAVRHQLNQVSLAEALRYLHQLPTSANIQQLMDGEHPFQQRLVFEELLAHHLSLLLLRRETQADGAQRLTINAALQAQFMTRVGFELTRAQRRVVDEIAADRAKPIPMLRLVQGAVGSG